MHRQSIRAALRVKADQTLLGLLRHSVKRADRRLVARAYANAAYRLGATLTPLPYSRYSHHQGKPVVLNHDMVHYIAGVK